MKKILSLILSAVMLFSLCLPAFAGGSSAALLNIYGDNMLFKQNTDAVFTGTAQGGARIDAELINAAGDTVKKGYGYANRSGGFRVSIPAPAGSYDRYTVKLYENGILFRTLQNVVFGELWLASGQSNMQYSLSGVYGGMEMYADGAVLSEWIRAFSVPPVTPYKGSNERIPVDPQNDIEGAFWTTGAQMNIYGISAVAYYFAEKLRQQLDMPVGVISASLGGSSIASWLSRDAIDGNAQVKQDFENAGEYITVDEWDEYGQSMYYDMTANYDLKIAPLAPFNITGMIWYQGETDVILQWKNGRYSRAFDLMQRSYSELFGFEDGLMPIVWTTLASYYYTDESPMEEMNYEFVQLRDACPESRALISIYDVPLDYLPDMGAIHPAIKQPVGERMANAAMGLVYGGDEAYLGTSVKNAEVKDGSVFVTLNNTGAGLVCGGKKLFGFSVCGENGVYVEADAEIVSPDTIRIFSEYVTEPVSAAYAYSMSALDSNLYVQSENGDVTPASCFVTDKSAGVKYTKYTAWADCENSSSWRVLADSSADGVYDMWESRGAQLGYDAESAFSGENGLRISGSSLTGFSVSPKMSYKEKLDKIICSDFENDFSDYGVLAFKVRNNGDKDAEITGIKLYKNAAVWYMPALKDGTDTSFTVPADGEWYTVEYDLNRLYLFGNKGGAVYANEKISDIKDIKLCFNAANADISIDEFRFAPEEQQGATSFEGSFEACDNLFELLCAFFTETIAKILKFFPTAVC